MELKTRILKWSTGVPVAMLNLRTAHKLGVHTQDRISIKTLDKNPKETSTIIDTVKDMIKNNEIAVSYELCKILGLKKGEKVDVNLSSPPKSLLFIKKKMNKKILSENELDQIIRDVVNNSLSEAEIALFISAVYKNGMNLKETINLIKAIRKTGNQLIFKNKLTADKHSVGGVPGNRTTPIVIPICAAAGITMPKNSSRAITSAAGTADVIETIARVDFSLKEIKNIIKKTNACMVWGGALGLVPADSKIIRIEKMLKIDSPPQLLASIMSKKLAAGGKYIIIDIPYGRGAKLDKRKAIKLKRKFEFLGKYFKKKLKCILTNGTQPIGNGVGPVMELLDVIKILDSKQEGPKDLEKKSLMLAGNLLEMTGKAKKGEGEKKAEEILRSGKAFSKFKEIIKAQRGSLKNLIPGKYQKNIVSKKTGKIKEIENKEINSLAIVAGCPLDKASGLYIYHHVGESVKKGEKIITIYAESKSRLSEAVKYYQKVKPIKIG